MHQTALNAPIAEPFPLSNYQPLDPAKFGTVLMPGMTESCGQTVSQSSDNVGCCGYVPTVSILDEANTIAGQDRSRDYGHPYDNHRRIADIWNVQLEKKLSAKIEPRDVALMMIGLKLARIVNSPNHRDSMVDIGGYLKCLEMIDGYVPDQKQCLQPGD